MLYYGCPKRAGEIAPDGRHLFCRWSKREGLNRADDESCCADCTATDAGEIEGASLRFGLFHGAESAATRELTRLVSTRCLPLIGGGHAILSWIALEDAAAAVVLALEHRSPRRVYNVVDDEPVSFADYASEMADQLGARPPRKLPKWLVRPFASNAAVFMDEVRIPVANTRLKRELVWQPAFPSFRSVLSRLAATGWLPTRAQ